MIRCIGISLGDVSGISPEVTLKALAAEAQADDSRYLILGDPQHLDKVNRQLGLHLPLQPFAAGKGSGRFLVHNSFEESLPLEIAPGSPAAARAAMSWLHDGAQRCLRHELDALVTAPVNKESIIHTGLPFIGQ